MIALARSLLQERPEDLPAGRLMLLASASSACFGAAIGAYVGGFQILYNAVKMPLYFIGTLALSFGAMHLFAARTLPARRTLARKTHPQARVRAPRKLGTGSSTSRRSASTSSSGSSRSMVGSACSGG